MKYILILYYKLALSLVVILIKRLEYIESLYLKGSFTNTSFYPGLSDLDFFLIGSNTNQNKLKLEKLFNGLNLFFPMVKDFDFCSRKESELLFSFGGAKFFPQENWKVLKGKPVEFNYYFLPSKYLLDLVTEIHFQFEWLFKNLKLRTKRSLYRTIVIERQFFKVKQLLQKADFEIQGDTLPSLFKGKGKFDGVSNEIIIKEFNNLLESSKTLIFFKDLLPKELPSCNFDEVFQESYFKEKLVIIDTEFQYNSKSHYYTLENFKLFYLAGCIDTYLLFDRINWVKNIFDRDFLHLAYFVRLLEGRGNRKHNKDYYEENLDLISKLQEKANRISGIKDGYTKMYFGLDIKIMLGQATKDAAKNEYTDLQLIYSPKRNPSDKQIYLQLAEEALYEFTFASFELFQLGLALSYGSRQTIFYTPNLSLSKKDLFLVKMKVDNPKLDIILGDINSKHSFLCAASWNVLYTNQYYPESVTGYYMNYLLKYKFDKNLKSSFYLTGKLEEKDFLNLNVQNISHEEKSFRSMEVRDYFFPSRKMITDLANVLKFNRVPEFVSDIGKLKYMYYENLPVNEQYYVLKDLSNGEQEPFSHYWQEFEDWILIGDNLLETFNEKNLVWRNLEQFSKVKTYYNLSNSQEHKERAFSLVRFKYLSEMSSDDYLLSYLCSLDDERYYIESLSACDENFEFIIPNLKSVFQMVQFENQKHSISNGLKREIRIDMLYPVDDEKIDSNFYKKIDGPSLALGVLDRGHYKLVINLDKSVEDQYWIESIDHEFKTPKFRWSGNSVVIYFSALKNRNDLILKSDESNHFINSIDILLLVF